MYLRIALHWFLGERRNGRNGCMKGCSVGAKKKERSQVTTITQIQTYHFFVLPFFLAGFRFRLLGHWRICFRTLTGFRQTMILFECGHFIFSSTHGYVLTLVIARMREGVSHGCAKDYQMNVCRRVERPIP